METDVVASQDICCALLIYESNGVTIKDRQCRPRTEMEDAGGEIEIDGVTTTDAYCDMAVRLGA